MKTFVLVLRLALWTNPLQRMLSCLVALFILIDSIVTLRMYFVSAASLRAANAKTGWNLTTTPAEYLRVVVENVNSHWVLMTITAASLLVAGVYWRIVSAARIVDLAPHGRGRMLGSVLGVVSLLALMSMSMRWLGLFALFLMDWKSVAGISYRETLAGMANCALVLSMAVVGLFVSSRSPFAALAMLIVLVLPGVSDIFFAVLPLSGVLPWGWSFPEREILPLRKTLPLLALVWIPFVIWYLRARRIRAPHWLAAGGQDVLAATLVSSAAPKSRSEALQRQLLGGTTVIRFGAQWFVIIGLLLGLQWLFAGLVDTDPALSARVMYASLCISPVVTTVFSFAAIRRSRTLWLLAESTRSEFFASIERILIRLNLVMALGFAVWMAVLWFTQWWRPGAAEDQVARALFQVMSLWSLGTLAIYAQFAGWPKWPVAMIAAGMLILLWWLTSLPETTPRQGAVTGLAATTLLIAAAVTHIVLRWQAQRRWCEGDFPRAVTSTASGT